MFDFEKLEVYLKAKTFNNQVFDYIAITNSPDRVTRDQLRRASFSIMLNIAEGSGRFSNADRRNFYVIARGSAFECVAIFDFLRERHFLAEEVFQDYNKAEELSKMLFAMIKNLKTERERVV